MAAETIYKPSGVNVELIQRFDDGEYCMVRSVTTGKVFIAHKGQIEEKSDNPPAKTTRRGGKRQVVKTEVPLFPGPNKININSATPQMLTQVLKGVGMKTATEIKELQQSMPGERFTKLEQLKSITRVDWDAVFETGTVFVE